jgi:chitinase
VDAVILSFLDVFNVGGLPDINLSNACAGTYFSGTTLLTCPAVGTGMLYLST